ncbi:hypothetical protein KY312_01090 [Candidatus Woesearchaeota archaeon]|nr:hypothetical protein [Candidatus Woesearchaeota archaeon]
MRLSENIAELIGMHVGDGTIYRTKWSLVCELRGGLNEKEYYRHVAKLLNSMFQMNFIPKFRSGGKQGCFGIQTSKKAVTSLFSDFGFNAGRKTHSVKIPDKIKNSTNKIKLAFIRGYFDTDGCLRFEKINNNKERKYPKIEFCTVSRALRDDLFHLLVELRFRPYKWGEKEFKICLAGKLNLEKFMNEVSPNNKKHLNKYLFWKKHGFYASNAGVA